MFKTTTETKPYKRLKAEQKALEMNLNDYIYGTFAEIGAGQEVARNFFQVGAAAGTIVKTMSAYDKAYSDAIYGEDNRYVSESRLYKMLDHEYLLIEERLKEKCEDRTFFVFADTVAAINYSKTIKGNGWLGVRYQHEPCRPSNDVVIHVKMLDNDNRLQQEAIGILGVNLLYACYYYRDNMEDFVKSLHDGLKDRVNIDFIRVSGDAFKNVDNRLLTLYLVKHGLTDVAMFNEVGTPIHASEFLYKKSLMVVRGNFRPPTLVTEDVIDSAFKQFKREENVAGERSLIMTEITTEYLTDAAGNIDDVDFLDRAKMINALGQKVIVSSCSNHQMLINYLQDYKVAKLGLVIGVRELLEIIEEKYEQNQDGRLLVAFGELFTRNIRIYAYPALDEQGTLMTAHNMPVPEGIKFLHRHLMDSHQIVEVDDFEEALLHIFPWDVIEKVKSGDASWKQDVPEKLISVIEENNIFRHD